MIIVLNRTVRVIHLLGIILVGDYLLYGGREVAVILVSVGSSHLVGGTLDHWELVFLHLGIHAYCFASH